MCFFGSAKVILYFDCQAICLNNNCQLIFPMTLDKFLDKKVFIPAGNEWITLFLSTDF
jgi:hypothetical protein